MPALLDVQRSMREQLLDSQEQGGELIAIYRNTVVSTLVNALRLSYPAVQRLVGDEFFEGASREFIQAHLPASAYLNDYGAEFPDFIDRFEPAATVPYLADVARLEWAVNRALHAPDRAALDVSRLAGLSSLEESALGTVSFSPHPSLSLLQLHYPADAIWRAVLDHDSDAMAAVDLKSGPVHLQIERDSGGLQVRRLSLPAWRFAAALSSGKALFEAISDGSELAVEEINALLANHLTSGRFIDFSWTGANSK